VLLVTTFDEAENVFLTRAYDVSDLVTCRDKSGQVWADHDGLIDLITTTIEPNIWDDVGGPGAIDWTSVPGAEVLVVRQTRPIHQAIQQLLDDLRAIARATGDDGPPLCEKPTGPTRKMLQEQRNAAIWSEYLGREDRGEQEMGVEMGMPGSAGAGQPAN
jgi:hypothetical protein